MKIALLVLALVALVQADMYLHNPRGSNNRLDEARRDRNNANRLFDSQNNNRGGYNVGSLYYYAGSILPIEWTNQHSCGDPNNHCEIIFQYMCEDNVRDGASTNTIPDNPILCENYDCNTDLEFGMHESFDYYLNCRLRYRNMGLFTADRNLRGDAARYTRQNPNGNRRGYECPEERDYYPYWHPTPWRDIAILTNNATRCRYYQRESANVKSRYACVVPERYLLTGIFVSSNTIPNNREDCEALSEFNPETQVWENGTWTEFPPDSRLSAPDCVESLWSRDNHLGNGMGGYPNYYNWTIPDIPHEHCVFRARYNISTADYDGWDGSVNETNNRIRDFVYDDETNEVDLRIALADLDVYSMFGFDKEEAKARGYVFRQNPVVKIFPDPSDDSVNFGLQLAIDTTQFGRTFQDRSHTFAIRSKPDNLDCTTIYNLNVRGKRGNIVQVYPGVEYDFVPNVLMASVDSCIHIQWTGSNTNPDNNDGQGKQGTDRSNIVLLTSQNYAEGTPGMAVPEGEKNGHWGNSYPANLDESATFLGLSRENRENLAFLTPAQYGGEMSELDDAGTYYDLGPAKVTQRGTYHYLCTRNNNFTNRSQKGKIIIVDNALTSKRIGYNGGSVEAQSASLSFRTGDLSSAVVIRMETYPDADSALSALEDANPGFSANAPGNEVSDYVLVDPMGEFEEGELTTATISLDIEAGSTNVRIYRANAGSDWTFEELDTRVSDNVASANTDQGGIFVASTPIVTLYVIIFTILAVVLIITLIVVGVVVYFVVRRDKWHKTKGKVSGGFKNLSRSFQKKV